MNEVAKLRAKTGLTQAEFAALFGFTDSAVCRWEKGNREPGPFVMDEVRAKVSEYLKNGDRK